MMQQLSRALFGDDAHGTIAYGYHLLSLIVFDRHGHGLVVGWAISSKENQRIWELFAKNLRRESVDSQPEVLMTDDTNSGWNGFRRIWRSLKHKLLCHWHIMKNVRERCGNRGAPTKSKVFCPCHPQCQQIHLHFQSILNTFCAHCASILKAIHAHGISILNTF